MSSAERDMGGDKTKVIVVAFRGIRDKDVVYVTWVVMAFHKGETAKASYLCDRGIVGACTIAVEWFKVSEVLVLRTPAICDRCMRCSAQGGRLGLWCIQRLATGPTVHRRKVRLRGVISTGGVNLKYGGVRTRLRYPPQGCRIAVFQVDDIMRAKNYG